MRLRLIASLFILLLLAAHGLAEPIKIAINPLASTGSPKALATEYLKRLLEERSSGRIHVTVIESADSNFDNILESLNKQQVQLALPEIRDLRNRLPVLQVFELPFLFRDRQHLYRVIDSETGLQILQASQQHNLKPLAVWDGATRQLLTDEILPSPGDIPSLLFAGVNTNRNENTLLEIQLPEASRLGGQQELDTLTLTNHSISGCVLLTHQGFWDRLPEDIKVIINGSVKDATLYIRELAERRDKDALDALKRNEHISTHSLSPEQRELWQKAMQQLYSQNLDQAKLNFIDMITNN